MKKVLYPTFYSIILPHNILTFTDIFSKIIKIFQKNYKKGVDKTHNVRYNIIVARIKLQNNKKFIKLLGGNDNEEKIVFCSNKRI